VKQSASPRQAAARTPPRPLLLASSSRHRRALLERFGVPFAVQSPAIDERANAGEPPLALVRRLAAAKARAIPRGTPPALVIASDQVAVVAGRVVGKPGTPAAAERQLADAVAARTAEFHTALCLLDQADGRSVLDVVSCRVSFRALSAAQIAAYVAREQPLDCAGSFMIEGLGIALFERIETDDPTALVGLPLMCLAKRLAEFGYEVLGSPP